MPEDAKEIEVPKLIIQPLCENSFTHAFKYCRHVWRIRVEAGVTEDGWQVVVTDNGPGFPEEYIKEFKEFSRSVTVENVRDTLEELSIGGLSITNIYMRMKLAYGDDAVFTAENTVDGTRLTMGRRNKCSEF